MATETTHRGYPLPQAENLVSNDRGLLEAALEAVDGDVNALFTALDGKAAAVHVHSIGDVSGLQTALDGKAAVNHLHSLDNLTDVSGAAAAALGYVLVKTATGWQPASPAASLGVHQHSIAQVTNLQSTLDGKATAADLAALTDFVNDEVTGLQQADAAILADPWALQPIGVPVPVMDNLTGVAAPPTDKTYRYVKLTAGEAGAGQYNEGLLTSESVGGSAPLVNATATISDAGSPMNGVSIRLLNTERRFLRAGSAGTIEQDAVQDHTHNLTLPRRGGNNNAQTPPASFVSDDAATGNATGTTTTHSGRGDTETRPKNIGVTYYMRIR